MTGACVIHLLAPIAIATAQLSAVPARVPNGLVAEGGDGRASGTHDAAPASNGTASGPAFTYEDALILQIRIQGIDATDTIVAYGTRHAVFLPLGELARILDLAIRVSDDGRYASGWFLSENRALTIDLHQGLLTTAAGTAAIAPGRMVAFDGELYLQSDALAELLPLIVEPDLRSQSVRLTTLEPFPFEERMRRDAARGRVNASGRADERFPREETPWLPLSLPMADVEMRAVSDSARGSRLEGDLRLAGDLAYLTAQTFFSATTRDGLVASLVTLGRRDVDGDMLGPMRATEFQLGDVASLAMPMGLRGVSGRGGFLTNTPIQSVSIFDNIDIRGVLTNGYEVELYRNDILLGSTRQAVNGLYEFLQVPVDYGLNVFRIVFYGPQGQRREEVRPITVGDGRIAAGRLEYTLGMVQRGENLLGVTGPDFRPIDGYRDWQAVGEAAYGISSALTGIASAAFYEDEGTGRWLVTTGARAGAGRLSIRADAGLSDGGGYGAGVGMAGRALGGALAVTHFEYGGGFVDEVRSLARDPLRRATEVDFNSSILIGGSAGGTYLPLTARARRVEYGDGREQTGASVRASARLPGVIASNSIEYSHNAAPGLSAFDQLLGNFDLATFNRTRTQLRGSLGYRLHPNPAITLVSATVDRSVDDRTMISASAAYALSSDDLAFGASAIREFDRFTLAFDSQYALAQDSYSIALRVGFSLARDPLRRNVYVDTPGRASSGTVALRAFHDLDGDGIFGPADAPLPDVDFAVQGEVATTDGQGFARLRGLGNGTRIAVQVDPSSLPDILMAPASRGIEIVPRAGRTHVTDFPIVSLNEVEGTVSFGNDADARGVSGLRLQLRGAAGGVDHAIRTERDGYYLFERVKPGRYDLVVDPEQAARLNICLVEPVIVVLEPAGGVVTRNFRAGSCDVAAIGATGPAVIDGSPPTDPAQGFSIGVTQ